MTYKEKETWLNRAYKLSLENLFITEEYNEMVRLRDKCISYGQHGGGNSGNNNVTENKFVSYANASDEYDKSLLRSITSYKAIKTEIRAAISKLENPAERTVLTARFIRFCSLSEIAKKTAYSLSYVKELKRRGIAHIEIKEHTK